ncbi:MAG: DUF1566 domain-containing protein [Thermodesulfovibrionales bacterium]
MRSVRVLTAVFLVLVFSLITSAWAVTVNLPQSGQKKCYDASGTEIACPGTGQDGEKQAGVAWPSPRFTDNGNGTITDNLTGLVWLKDANCANAVRTWSQALSDVNELNTSGTMNGNNCGDTSNGGSHQTDWRLPNINELESLVHAGYNEENCGGSACSTLSAWLNNKGFSNVQSNYYWSSTTYAYYTDYAWLVPMWNGVVYASNKAYNCYVWPVRAGQ